MDNEARRLTSRPPQQSVRDDHETPGLSTLIRAKFYSASHVSDQNNETSVGFSAAVES